MSYLMSAFADELMKLGREDTTGYIARPPGRTISHRMSPAAFRETAKRRGIKPLVKTYSFAKELKAQQAKRTTTPTGTIYHSKKPIPPWKQKNIKVKIGPAKIEKHTKVPGGGLVTSRDSKGNKNIDVKMSKPVITSPKKPLLAKASSAGFIDELINL